MRMKVIIVLTVVVLSLSLLILTMPNQVLGEPQVGVKGGDWVEYTVKVKGPTYSTSHNITWFRVDILNAEGQMLQANVTVRNVNETITSSVWKFNFTEGQVEGWVMIPGNLGVGDSFFDSAKPGNVTIEGEEQKMWPEQPEP
jgi:competence protein ComGC